MVFGVFLDGRRMPPQHFLHDSLRTSAARPPLRPLRARAQDLAGWCLVLLVLRALSQRLSRSRVVGGASPEVVGHRLYTRWTSGEGPEGEP